MSRRVLIIDTSILCVWLKVPGMETCGKNVEWNFELVDKKIREELALKTTFVLPLATIIETGNHICQIKGDCFDVAMSLADLLRKSADSETPWAAFSEQAELWTNEKLRSLASSWPKYAAKKLSMGDFTIKDVAEYYASKSFSVEIFTGDGGLKAYEQTIASEIEPRRYSKRF